ncbi:peptidoglycan D,D-transpeptidase FtsI family protein [Desulfofundulus thermobenzoicus]|nr:penicillin-binding protein 2 [Desulfofundulus thermobenzoicus]
MRSSYWMKTAEKEWFVTVYGKRLLFLFSFFLLAFALLLMHLGVIQIGRGEQYAFLALERQTRSLYLEDYPRGDILDRRGQSLTGRLQANRVVVFPSLIPDRTEAARFLGTVLGVPADRISPYLTGDPAYLPRDLTPGMVETIREKGMPGIVVLPVSFRYGPRPLAVQVVGYLGRAQSRTELAALQNSSGKAYQLNDWIGQAGLEKFYEQELKATRPRDAARLFVDAAGRPLPGLGLQFASGRKDPGRRHVVTTIDARIQQVVENVMDRRVKKGAVVVMDTRTGDILALASRPAYDPRPEALPGYLLTGEKGTFMDQATALFQPGSVFKVVVAAAALAEGLVTPDSRFTCRGSADEPVRCWYGPGHGNINFSRAFAESCNPVFVRVGLELGPEKIIEYARRFGLDNQAITGYPVTPDPRQDLGLIAASHNLVNSSLGQGPVLATPVQLAAMINVLANNGTYIQPRLVMELRDDGGRPVRTFPVEKGHRVLPPSVVAQLREMMEQVTTRGVGREAYLPGCGSAGKTGSAQVDDHGRVNAWFSGYAPVHDPRYTITVLVREGISGGESAAPVFREIMEQILPLPPA